MNSLRLASLLAAALFLAGCATRAPQRLDQPSLREVALAYKGACTGGKKEPNNCAHFLSDAFIEAGYTELLDHPRITQRCVCGAGRVVKAQDLLRWFQEKSLRFHQGAPPKNSGVWAGYQEKPGRRHVLLLDTDTGKYFGTDNCVSWPVQWFYQW